jgi:hypothetical protein
MSVDPVPSPPSEDPATQPSTNPDGPQPISAPGTPEGEPGPDADPERPGASIPFDNRVSNPNSGGDLGLSGDMGVSSERTGPAGPDHRGSDISGTGSKGGAVERTDGGIDTSATEWDAVDVSQEQLYPDRDEDRASTGSSGDFPGQVDRTVGEPRPEPIADEKSRR